jgi:hypothetical protein
MLGLSGRVRGVASLPVMVTGSTLVPTKASRLRARRLGPDIHSSSTPLRPSSSHSSFTRALPFLRAPGDSRAADALTGGLSRERAALARCFIARLHVGDAWSRSASDENQPRSRANGRPSVQRFARSWGMQPRGDFGPFVPGNAALSRSARTRPRNRNLCFGQTSCCAAARPSRARKKISYARGHQLVDKDEPNGAAVDAGKLRDERSRGASRQRA